MIRKTETKLGGATIWRAPKEYVWDRVRRMRYEEHPLMYGGQFKEQPLVMLSLSSHNKGIALRRRATNV